MSLSGKALGVKIIIANTIALIILAYMWSGQTNPQVAFQTPESLNGSPSYNPSSFNVQYQTPNVGIALIDALIAFYFVFSYAVAVWLVVNPFSG